MFQTSAPTLPGRSPIRVTGVTQTWRAVQFDSVEGTELGVLLAFKIHGGQEFSTTRRPFASLVESKMMEFTSDSAKQFLPSKLIDQAARDGVGLDATEKGMFVFSEASGSVDSELAERFDKEYDATSYEAKLSKLLRRSYAHDKRSPEGKREWKHALDALSREDFYGLVMVDQARIPRVDKGLWAFVIEMLPFGLVELLVLATGFVVVFKPSILRFYMPDWLRLILFPFFLWLFWYVGQIFSRATTKNSKNVELAKD